MARHVSAPPKRFAALAILALVASFLSSAITPAVAATVDALTAKSVTDRAFATKLIRNQAAKTKAVFVADATALSNRAFVALSARLEAQGQGVYSGEIDLEQLRSVAAVSGLRISQDLRVSVSPLKAQVTRVDGQDQIDPAAIQKNAFGVTNAPTAGLYKWSGSDNVVNQDPLFDSVRGELGIDGTGQTVAVLDTGIDTNAVGLGGRVVYRHDFTNGSAGASCSDNGYLDPYGHGTHVSSIIGGQFDGTNPASEGMAPGVKFVDLRVLDCSGSGTMAGVDGALSWLIDNHETYGITVANLSLGTSSGQADGKDTTSILINRLVAEGVVVVVAAGNSGDGASTIFTLATSHFGVTVGAMSTSAAIGPSLAPFSSQGPTSDGRPGVDLVAPGVGITAAASSSRGGGVVAYSGTSMATPYTAGLVALMRQQHPEYVVGGQSCSLSAECELGVVVESMQNQFLDNIKTSDWFQPGVDSISGAGAVSASATLLGTPVAPQTQSRVSFVGGNDNELTVPAHDKTATLTIMLDSTYRPDIWANQYFVPTLVYPDGRVEAVDNSCYNLSDWSCLIYSNGFSPRMINITLPGTSDSLVVRVRTTATLDASLSAVGISGEVTMVSHSAISSSLADDTAILNEDGDLPSSASPISDSMFIATDGTIYAMSKASFAKRAGAYSGIAKFAAGSSTASEVAGLTQNSQSQLDLIGMASNGSKLLLGEFPAGSGIVEGDEDVRYQLFVHDTATHANVAVGPPAEWTNTYPETWRQMFPGFDVGNNLFNSNFMSNTGNSIGYGYMEFVDGVEKQVIGWQGGTGFATHKRWYFSVDSRAHIEAVSDSHLLVVRANSRQDGYELLKLEVATGGTPVVIASNHENVWASGKFSADATAIGMRTSADTIRCQDGATVRDFRTPTGTNFYSLNGYRGTGWAVANDCSSVTANIYTPYMQGQSQIRILSNGTVETLATAGNQSMSWSVDSSGTHWVTTSIAAFDAADINGIVDYYRGIRTSSFTNSTLDLSGSQAVGSTMRARWSSAPSGFTIGYQWLRDGNPIIGETSADHIVTIGDSGLPISVQASLIKSGEASGTVTSQSALWVSARTYTSTPKPLITGESIIGATLSASVPAWSPSSRRLHYQWFAGTTLIKGATTSKIKITEALPPGPLTVKVTNRLPDFEAKTVQSDAAAGSLASLSRTPTPTIKGSTRVGQILTATVGSWDTGVAMTYQWLAGGEPIAGATARTLKLSNAHAGLTISFSVSGSKANYQSTTRTSSGTAIVTGGTFASAKPSVIGLAAVGNNLSVNLGDWGANAITFSYKWLRGNKAISGATDATYTATSADLGSTIAVTITATKAGFTTTSKTTSATAKVGQTMTLTPTPLIAGTPIVGRTLTVTSGTWDSGVRLSYQWFRNGSAISRSTSSSYKLTSADRGKQITVSVTANKTNYATVVLFSAAVGPVG